VFKAIAPGVGNGCPNAIVDGCTADGDAAPLGELTFVADGKGTEVAGVSGAIEGWEVGRELTGIWPEGIAWTGLGARGGTEIKGA
jgi:hypothetical protein